MTRPTIKFRVGPKRTCRPTKTGEVKQAREWRRAGERVSDIAAWLNRSNRWVINHTKGCAPPPDPARRMRAAATLRNKGWEWEAIAAAVGYKTPQSAEVSACVYRGRQREGMVA